MRKKSLKWKPNSLIALIEKTGVVLSEKFNNQLKSIIFINEYLEQTTQNRVVLNTINQDLGNEYKSEANVRTGFEQSS